MIEKKEYESPNVCVILQCQDVITTSAPEPIDEETTRTFEGYERVWW